MAEGKKFNGLPDATGSRALKFIYRHSFCPLTSPKETLHERTSAFFRRFVANAARLKSLGLALCLTFLSL